MILNPNFLVIIQARTSSSRIPNKVLRKVGVCTLLELTIKRIRIKNPNTSLVVCTSNLQSDFPIYNLCKNINIECFKGSLSNVASRYFEICKSTNFDAFVRICADSPMIDGDLLKLMLENWEYGLDLLTNKSPRSFPKGQSIEVVNRNSFLKLYERFETDDDFEHVTHYFHRNLTQINYKNLRSSEDHSNVSLAIDEPKDLVRFESFVKQYGSKWLELSFEDILKIYPINFD